MWKYFIKHAIFFFTVFFVTGCGSQPFQNTSSGTTVLIEQIKESLLKFKKSEKVEGLAFAIFDKDKIILKECLGNSTYGYPINDETWLKFHAGTDYSYSNSGLDLAAKIVEQVSGIKYSDYLRSKVFEPLEMSLTTIDDHKILTSTNKTEGTISFTKTRHYNIPLLGSGAVYTNLSDFIKYVQRFFYILNIILVQ